MGERLGRTNSNAQIIRHFKYTGKAGLNYCKKCRRMGTLILILL